MSVSVQQMANRVADLMEQRLRVGGSGLAAKLERGARFLPRKVRREARYLAEADQAARVPRLQMQLDYEKIARAYDVCVRYLKPLGASARRKAILLDILTGFGSGIFVTIVLVLVVMMWRGFL